MKPHRMIIAFVLAVLAGLLVPLVPNAQAYVGDPVVTVTAPAEVQAGTPIVFNVTIDLSASGYAPTNGSQKITFRTAGGSTLNVANYTVIPMTKVAPDLWTFTYVPSASEVGRVEVFSVSTPFCLTGCLRNPRTIVGSAGFRVTATP